MSEEFQHLRSRDLPSLSRHNRGLRTGGLQHRSSTNTTRSTSAFLPNRKYENVERIAAVYEELRRDNAGKSSYGVSTATPAERADRAERVMEGFKEKIRANFNSLYMNYDGNKEQISSEIRLMEKNKTVHTEMSIKFEQTLKEKNQYDKIRAQVKEQQRKLIRLKEVLEKQNGWRLGSQQIKEELDRKLQELQKLQNIKQELDYHKAIMVNMREQRRNRRNVVRTRFVEDWRQWCRTNLLIDRFWNEAEAKKVMQHNLALQMPTDAIMPEKLAMNLETRLEEFYGKQAYLNIFEHQNILNEQANREEQRRLEELREDERRRKQNQDRKEKKNYQEVDAKVSKFRTDQEIIRKTCGINDIEQVSEGLLMQGGLTLEQLKTEYDERLKEINEQNIDLQEEIQRVLSGDASQQQDLRAIKKEYTRQHEEERKLFNQVQKCRSFLESLMFIVERVTEEPGTKKDMNMMLAAFSSKMERLVLAGKMERPTGTTTTYREKTHVVREDTTEKDGWEEASHEDEEVEYINMQFMRNKAHHPQ